MHASPEVNAIDFKYTCMTVPRLTQNKHTFKCSRVWNTTMTQVVVMHISLIHFMVV